MNVGTEIKFHWSLKLVNRWSRVTTFIQLGHHCWWRHIGQYLLDIKLGAPTAHGEDKKFLTKIEPRSPNPWSGTSGQMISPAVTTTMMLILKTATLGTATALRKVLMLRYSTRRFSVGQGELYCTFCKTFIMENCTIHCSHRTAVILLP